MAAGSGHESRSVIAGKRLLWLVSRHRDKEKVEEKDEADSEKEKVEAELYGEKEKVKENHSTKEKHTQKDLDQVKVKA